MRRPSLRRLRSLKDKRILWTDVFTAAEDALRWALDLVRHPAEWFVAWLRTARREFPGFALGVLTRFGVKDGGRVHRFAEDLLDISMELCTMGYYICFLIIIGILAVPVYGTIFAVEGIRFNMIQMGFGGITGTWF